MKKHLCKKIYYLSKNSENLWHLSHDLLPLSATCLDHDDGSSTLDACGLKYRLSSTTPRPSSQSWAEYLPWCVGVGGSGGGGQDINIFHSHPLSSHHPALCCGGRNSR